MKYGNAERRSLLIVEDNPMMAEVVGNALRRRGYEVSVAHSIADARQRVMDKLPLFALIDLRLPDGSGLALVQELRRASHDAKIVVLTGFANIATAIEAIKLGASNYLCKPAGVEAIDAALQGRSEQLDADEAESPPTVPGVQTEYIQRALADNCSNISATARALGMHRRTLQRILSRSQDVG